MNGVPFWIFFWGEELHSSDSDHSGGIWFISDKTDQSKFAHSQVNLQWDSVSPSIGFACRHFHSQLSPVSFSFAIHPQLTVEKPWSRSLLLYYRWVGWLRECCCLVVKSRLIVHDRMDSSTPGYPCPELSLQPSAVWMGSDWVVGKDQTVQQWDGIKPSKTHGSCPSVQALRSPLMVGSLTSLEITEQKVCKCGSLVKALSRVLYGFEWVKALQSNTCLN